MNFMLWLDYFIEFCISNYKDSDDNYYFYNGDKEGIFSYEDEIPHSYIFHSLRFIGVDGL